MKLERVLCPICSRDDAGKFLPFGPDHLVRCRTCGLVYSNPRRSMDEVSEFFEEKYIPDQKKLKRELGAWRAESLLREAEIIKAMKPAGAILDIGCAGGHFLEHFLGDGWECTGVEPSRVAAEEAGRKGIRIFQSVLNQADMDLSDHFDVVTYLDTLFFSSTPVDDLKKISRLLKSDGRLFLDLPGFTYRIARNYGPLCLLIDRRWTNFKLTSPHLFILSTRTLRKMLSQAGMEIEAVHLEQAPARGSSLMRLINRAHYEFCRLLFNLSGGSINLAAKAFYVCRKIDGQR